MDKKIKHLEMLQAAIGRMAGNLFLLKGWSITLIAALFALSAKDADPVFAGIAYFPLFVFWALDGFFLSQERRFRALYDHVRLLDESEIDFSMDTRPHWNDSNTWSASLFSKTLLIYYVGLSLILFFLLLVIA